MSCFISQQYCSHASDYLLSWCQLLAKSSTLPALGTGTCGDSRGRGQTFAGMVGDGDKCFRGTVGDGGKCLQGRFLDGDSICRDCWG